MIDYKLADVPDLGYFRTDQPHPEASCWSSRRTCSPATTNGRRSPPRCSTPDGYYRTGDIMAEVGPDQLVYLDRRNNVLKLSQGEFVTVSKLEAVFGDSPLVRQIYVYGNSARAYLLAVVVPTDGCAVPQRRRRRVAQAAHQRLAAECREGGRAAVLRDPARLHHRDNAVHAGERSAHRHPQAGAPEAQGALRRSSGTALRRAGRKPGQRAARAAPQRCRPAGAGDHQPGRRRAAGRSGHRSAPDAHFTDLGGDSLSALTFANLLHEIFDIDVPVGVIVSPATDLQVHRRLHRGRADIRHEAANVCGGARPRRHRGARP